MMDGRNVYTPSFGGVFWEVLDLPWRTLKDRSDSGSGGSIWGGNAVNGVVNIIQKKTSETTGAMVVAGGGHSDQGFGTTQFGGRAGEHVAYRIYSKYFNESELKARSAEKGGDGYHVLRGGFRADATLSAKDSLTVQGNRYAGREGDPPTILLSITASGPVNAERLVNLSWKPRVASLAPQGAGVDRRLPGSVHCGVAEGAPDRGTGKREQASCADRGRTRPLRSGRRDHRILSGRKKGALRNQHGRGRERAAKNQRQAAGAGEESAGELKRGLKCF
jgi:hypothetical protein